MTQDPSAQNENQTLRDLLERDPKTARVIGAAILIIATLIAYIPAMRGGFIWDDDYYVTENTLLRNWEGLQRIWFGVIPDPSAYALPQYYPMTHTTFWIEYRLWGLNPAGYHTVNVVLHICNALLIWLILTRLSVPGSWLAAAIFAVHPLHVESVAWVAERKNVLSLMLFLSSLYVYLRFARVIEPAAPRAPRPASKPGEPPQTQIEWFTLPDDPQRLYALAAVLFVLALLSKTVTSSMPAVALLIIWWKRGRVTGKDITPLLPLFVVGAAMGMLTAHMERVRVGVAARPHEWDYADTFVGEIAARFIIAGKVIWFYIQKLVWPNPLLFNYSRWQINPQEMRQYLFILLAAAVTVALLLLRGRIGRGAVAAVLIYLVTLFPAMGFFDVWPMQFSFVADHFVYLPSIALIALFAALVTRYLTLEVVAGVAAVLVVVFIGLTFRQGGLYKDEETLWRRTWLDSGRTSWLAANNYGNLLLKRSPPRLPEAEEWFNAVIKLKPNHPESRFNLSRIALMRADIAERIHARAATQPTSQPHATTQPAQYLEQAEAYLREAIEIQPNYVDAHYELAMLLLRLDRKQEALQHLDRVLEHYPRHEMAYITLGNLALEDNDLGRAVECFATAVELNPDSPMAHERLGLALLRAGRVADGMLQWEDVLRLDPTNPDWPNKFGAWMASSGEYRKAAEYFNRAMQIDPAHVEAMTNMGVAAALAGFPQQARDWFERALSVDPDFPKARENLEALNSGRLTTRPTTLPSTESSTRPAS